MTISAPRTQRRDAAENRTALLDAARLVLNQDPDASLETIATAAGLSRRAVYGHFRTRDELLTVLLNRGAATVVAGLENVTHPDPVVRLALIASRLWAEVENIRVMALFAVRGPFKRQTAVHLAPLRARVRAAVIEGQESGAIRSDIEVERLARLIEDAALAVLEESARAPLAQRDGHHLVMLTTLGTIGLGWRDAQTIIDSHSELAWKDARS
jgi:AcrR family transcriptional regulator